MHHTEASHPSATTREPVSITNQLRAMLRELGRDYYFVTDDGLITWVIEDQPYAPWRAANAFLPGGWTAAMPRSQGRS
jgi:hypothetical protein